MLPFSYLIRNLLRRRVRTLVTILGIAATTLLVIAMTAFAEGMREAAGGNVRHDSVYLLGTSAEVDLVRSVVPRGSAEVAAASVDGVLEVDGVRAALAAHLSPFSPTIFSSAGALTSAGTLKASLWSEKPSDTPNLVRSMLEAQHPAKSNKSVKSNACVTASSAAAITSPSPWFTLTNPLTDLWPWI